MNDDQELQSSPGPRALWLAEIRNIIIGLVVIVIIWSILSFALPDGWWHLVMNIVGFLVTGFWAWSMKSPLARLTTGWFAWIIAILVWLVMFVGLRTIELTALEAIF
jgi:hypothetical protein